MIPTCDILTGDALRMLLRMPSESVQCCVTSPPYWGLRDYGVKGQLGLERTPALFLRNQVRVFEEVRRVLKKDGTLWMNMGDSYASTGGHSDVHCNDRRGAHRIANRPEHQHRTFRSGPSAGIKAKELCGMPWRLAFALQEAGWYLRSDIIWHKPNPMPESVRDRPTKAHEYIFLLSKSKRYYYDAAAIREPASTNSHARVSRAHLDHKSAPDERRNGIRARPGVGPKTYKMPDGWNTGPGAHGSFHPKGREKGKTPGRNSRVHEDRDPAHLDRITAKRPRANESFSAAVVGLVDDRNKRSVWTVPTAPYREAHYATFPPDLIKPCILAGSRPGDKVLDPYGGSGTTGMVALELGRSVVMIELNPASVLLIRQRTRVTPGLALA